MPTSSNVERAFKVYTDVERSYPSIICPITATINQGYAPVSIVDSYTKVRVDPSLVSVPGGYGSHPITVEINSRDYPSIVVYKLFNFDVIITCTVSSLTIQTTVTDFAYVLNSGSITKGTFTPVQIPDC